MGGGGCETVETRAAFEAEAAQATRAAAHAHARLNAAAARLSALATIVQSASRALRERAAAARARSEAARASLAQERTATAHSGMRVRRIHWAIALMTTPTVREIAAWEELGIRTTRCAQISGEPMASLEARVEAAVGVAREAGGAGGGERETAAALASVRSRVASFRAALQELTKVLRSRGGGGE